LTSERRERIELLEPQQVDVVDPARVALFQQVVIDLARAHHDALDLVVGHQLGVGIALLGVVPEHPVEAGAGGEILGVRDRQLVAQQRFRRHQHQRLAEAAVQLAAQDVEVVRRRRAVGDDPVVLGAHLQEPFQPGRGVLRPLALEAVRQQHHEARHAQPFAFARLMNWSNMICAPLAKVAELRLPQGQRVGFGQRIAVFEAQHRVFRQHRVDDLVLRLALADVVERVVAFLGFLVDQAENGAG
jgi:hypothetical protein